MRWLYQVWVIIAITLLMSVPGTVLAVGFNTLFASAVPEVWRSRVVGTRNALLALTYMGSSLLCGWLLSIFPFPVGYQIVFGIGFVGAFMSSVHTYFIQANMKSAQQVGEGDGRLDDRARPGLSRAIGDGLRTFVGLRFLTKNVGRPFLNLKILRGSYGRLMGLLFIFHLAQFLANPLYPLYFVNQLNLLDHEIGFGTALFYGTYFFGSTQINRLVKGKGNHLIMTLGMISMSFYPFLIFLTRGVPFYLVTSAVGGVAWAMVEGAFFVYWLPWLCGNGVGLVADHKCL